MEGEEQWKHRGKKGTYKSICNWPLLTREDIPKYFCIELRTSPFQTF